MGFMQSDWEITVVLDLFMGGSGAGILVLSVLLWLFAKERYRKAAAGGAWVCFVCIVVGLICLLSDVGQPFRAMILPVSFSHFPSWMAFGAWFMFITLLASFVFGVSITDRAAHIVVRVWKGFAKVRRGFAVVSGIIGVASGFMVTVYTGFLISSATGVPFWSTILLPIGFCASAFYLAACAMIVLVIIDCRRAEPEEGIDVAEGDSGDSRNSVSVRTPGAVHILRVVALVCGIVFVAIVMLHLSLATSGDLVQSATLSSENATDAARESAAAIMTGDLSVLFRFGMIIVGLAIPLVLIIVSFFLRRVTRAQLVIAVIIAVCALVGVFAWRYLVLAVGIHQALSSVDVSQFTEGGMFTFRGGD